MPNRILTSRLAAKAGTRQVEASAKADQAALAADAAIVLAWERVLSLLRRVHSRMSYQDIMALAIPVFRQIHVDTAESIDRSMQHIAVWGHKTAARNYTDTLPLGYMQVAALTPEPNKDVTLAQVPRAQFGATLNSGKEIRFGAHPNQRKSETTIMVDTGKLDASWSQDESYYIPSGGGGVSEVPGRRAGFETFLEKGKTIEAPRAVIDKGIVSIEDGRHRLSVLRDQGADRVALTVPRRQAEQFERLFPPPPRPPLLLPAPPSPPPFRPGIIELGRSEEKLTAKDLAAHLRGTDVNSKEELAKVLFPAPSLDDIERVMNHPRMGVSWRAQLQDATKLMKPDDLASVLSHGVASGVKTQREIAEDILPFVNGDRVSARRIARTEGLRVAHQFQEEAASKIDVLIMGKQILALLDIVTRPAHRARNGRVWLRDSGVDMMTALQMEAPTLPDNFNCRCVTGSCRIRSSGIRSISRMFYTGESIEFRTTRGASLTVTANHPIATQRGIVAASEIDKSDYFVSDTFRDSQLSSAIDDGVSTIEDVFEAFSISGHGLCTKRPNSLEFHGDGQFADGHVHVVRTDFPLMTSGDPDFIERNHEAAFIRGTPFNVGRSNLLSSGPLIHSGPLRGLGFRLTSDRNTGFHELSNKSGRSSLCLGETSGETEFIGQGFERFASDVSSDQFRRGGPGFGKLNRFCFGPDNDSASYEPSFDGVSTDAKFIADLCQRHTGRIAFDKVVKIRRFQFDSFVYSVDTDLGYYMGSDGNGGILQGNCHFSDIMRPPSWVNDQKKMGVFRAAADRLSPDNAVYADWFAGADERLQRIAVGTKRYSTVRDLVGDEMRYEHFVDLQGNLLSARKLQAESPEERSARVAALTRESAQRRILVRDMATFGFLPPF